MIQSAHNEELAALKIKMKKVFLKELIVDVHDVDKMFMSMFQQEVVGSL